MFSEFPLADVFVQFPVYDEVGSGLQWLEENSSRTTFTLPDGRKKVTFNDGGIAIIELNGDIKTITESPMLNAPGEFL